MPRPIAVSYNEEDKTPKDPVGTQRRNRIYSAVLLLTSAACCAWWVAAVATDKLAPYDGGMYRSTHSCIDVMVAEFLLSICCAAAVIAGDANAKALSAASFAKFIGYWFVLGIVTKLWMYKAWSDSASVADTIGFAASGVMCFPRVYCLASIKDPQAPAGKPFKWEATKMILKPYLVPEGVRNKVLVCLTWAALIASKVCNILSPLVLGQIVNNLGETPPNPSYGLIAAYGALGLLPNLLTEVQDVLYVKVWQTAYVQVAELTYRHVHRLSLDWHLRKKMGAVLVSIDRGQQAADNVMYYLLIFLLPALASALVTFIVFAVHFDQPQIAAVCFFGFLTYCLVTYVVTLWRKKFRQGMNKSDNAMHDKASDSLINFETVKYFSNEDYEIKQYLDLVIEYQKGGYKTQASVSVLNVAQAGIMQLCMLGALSIAAYCIFNNKDSFDAGEFVAVQAYVLTIFTPLNALGWVYTMVTNGAVDIQNLGDLLAERPDIVDRPNAIDFTKRRDADKGGVGIEVKNVRFRYPSQPEGGGLHDVSFSVPAGTTTAIVGETGSGKTTLSRLLFRFYDLQSGDISLNGVSIKDMTQKSLRQSIGVVPQDTVMFNDTVKYNIKYGKLDATDDEVIEASTKAQVHKFIQNLEKSYDTVVGERGLKLSGGEKQRLAIARCLLKNPPVVLLDEATSALDNKTERELQKALKCLAGRTTVVIAHRLTTIQHAEQIIVMRLGRIVERGTHEELLALGSSGYYYTMWNAQLIEDTKHAVEGGDVDADILASPNSDDPAASK